MKSPYDIAGLEALWVTLRVRVWIEILAHALNVSDKLVTLRVRVWIEIFGKIMSSRIFNVTLRVRVWIEISVIARCCAAS